MKDKFALLGIAGLLVAYISIGVSILLSPWFSWWSNALSDLGHATKSDVAPLFNFGLLLSGFFMSIYTIIVMRKYAMYTGYSLFISAFLLQLIATFNETYSFLHTLVSVLFFASLGFASVIYALEMRSIFAMLSFIIGSIVWIFYFIGVYRSGIAIPEILSSVIVTAWIMLLALKNYLEK